MATNAGSANETDLQTSNDQVLSAAIKNLTLEGNEDLEKMTDFISKLETTRSSSVDENRRARKAAWIQETHKEICKRRDCREFRNHNLLEVFPELAWKSILEQLEEPDDKAMMSNMCLLWRDLLMGQRTKFLFHAIFPVLFEMESDSDGSDCPIKNPSNLRLVCKEWKKSMETYIHEAPFVLDGITPLEPFSAPDQLLLIRFDVDNVDARRIARFMQWGDRFYPPGGNPIFSRKLWLGVQTLTLPDGWGIMTPDFWTDVERLLVKWGREVWQVYIFQDSGLQSPAASYSQLCRMLTLMPNLRHLKVEADPNLCKYAEAPAQLRKLERNILQNPLPDLPHLKNLAVLDIPAPIVKAMMNRYGATLQSLSLGALRIDINAYAGPTSLHHFKMLVITSPCISLPTSGFTVVQDSSKVEDLRMLCLNVQAMDIPLLFQNINAFGKSLRKLTLSLHKIEGPIAKLAPSLVKMLTLELPHLERFTCSVARVNLKTIDFILPMKCLRELQLVYIKSVSSFEGKAKKKKSATPGTSEAADCAPKIETPGEIIKFENFANRLYESNIWKLFPELMQVTIVVVSKLKETERMSGYAEGSSDEEGERKNEMMKEKIYTREGYKKFQMENGNDKGTGDL